MAYAPSPPPDPPTTEVLTCMKVVKFSSIFQFNIIFNDCKCTISSKLPLSMRYIKMSHCLGIFEPRLGYEKRELKKKKPHILFCPITIAQFK